MSAIAGIVLPVGRKVDHDVLERMSDKLSRRGPDGWASSSVDNAGFVMTWLGSTPEASHDCGKPLEFAGGQVVVADARLDNREELISLLRLSRSGSDREIIAACYEKWQDKCVEHIEGDFAIAIWDSSKRQLLLARDFWGTKSLYVSHLPDGSFAFASEVAAILSLPEVRTAVNHARVVDFFFTELEAVDNTSTFYQDIERFPPGCVGLLRNGHCRKSDFGSIRVRHATYSDDACADRFREVFGVAVKKRMAGFPKTAAMLSGGMDSSAIVGFARQIAKQQDTSLVTLSANANDNNSIESRFLRSVIDQGHVDPIVVTTANLEEFRPHLEQAMSASTDLFDSQMGFMPLLFYQAKQRGVKAVLDGVDGDIVASANITYLRQLLRRGRLAKAIQEAILHNRNLVQGSPFQPWRMLYGNAMAILPRPRVVRFVAGAMRRKGDPPVEDLCRHTIVSRELARDVNLTERLRQARQHNTTKRIGSLPEQHASSLRRPFLTAALERYDRAASYWGVESRHPFFDRQVVEFFVSLPWHHKVRNGWSKYTLRRCTEMLPSEVRWRREYDHLGWTFTYQLVRHYLAEIRDHIARPSPELASYIDMSVASEYLRIFDSTGEAVYADRLWAIIPLMRWIS